MRLADKQHVYLKFHVIFTVNESWQSGYKMVASNLFMLSLCKGRVRYTLVMQVSTIPSMGLYYIAWGDTGVPAH
jgi:hypothetical protein